jgi:hypothetical protein
LSADSPAAPQPDSRFSLVERCGSFEGSATNLDLRGARTQPFG